MNLRQAFGIRLVAIAATSEEFYSFSPSGSGHPEIFISAKVRFVKDLATNGSLGRSTTRPKKKRTVPPRKLGTFQGSFR